MQLMEPGPAFPFSDFVYYLVALFATIVIFLVQYRSIFSSSANFDVHRPSTFFELNRYLSRNSARIISFTGSFPLAALFFVVCWRSKESITGIVKEFGPKIVNSFLPATYHDSVIRSFDVYFHNLYYLSPLVMLMAGLLLFAPYVNVPVLALHKLFIGATGVHERIDEIITEKSSHLLGMFGGDFNSFRESVEKTYNINIPLSENLAGASPSQKVSYVSVFVARNEIRNIGLRAALERIFKKLGGEAVSDTINPNPNWISILLPVPAFVTLCILFALVSSYGEPKRPVMSPEWSPYLIEWVNDPFQAATQVLRYFFCFLIPLYMGFIVYLSRRRGDDTFATISDCVRPACYLQLILSLLFSFVYCFLDSLQVIAGIQANASSKDAPYSLVTTKFWFDVITIALMPVLLFLVWIFCRYYLKFRNSYLSLILVFGGGLFPAMQSFLYEWYTHNWRGLYWYWAVLGIFISMSIVFVGFRWNYYSVSRQNSFRFSD